MAPTGAVTCSQPTSSSPSVMAGDGFPAALALLCPLGSVLLNCVWRLRRAVQKRGLSIPHHPRDS